MNKKTKIKLETTSAITTPSIIEKTVELAVDGWVKGNKKLIQVLREENKVWTDFLSPKNPECTSSQEYYDGMKVVIATGLGKLDLYNEDPKNNEPRNELVREITSKLKDLRKLLKPKAEKSEPRTPAQMFLDYLNKADALFEKGNRPYRLGKSLTNFSHPGKLGWLFLCPKFFRHQLYDTSWRIMVLL